MNYDLSIPDIYNIENIKNIEKNKKYIFSKTILLQSDKIYDLDDIFDIKDEYFTGLYFKTEYTNIYLSTNNFKDAMIYNNFFILDLFNGYSNYYNFIAKEYDADLTIYVITKPTTNMYTYKYIFHNKSYKISNTLYSECLDMNIITLQINIICKNDKLNNILKFESNENIFYFKSRIIKKINNTQYLYIFCLHKIENYLNNDSIYIDNILNINNIDNVITYIYKLNEINGIIFYFLFKNNKYGTYYINFSNYIIKNNIDKLYFFVLNFR
jgi:hypothetical protein